MTTESNTLGDPDADVKVLDSKGKIAITRLGDTLPITFSVDPGTHQVKRHDGEGHSLSQKFVIEPGGDRAITAKLVPLGEGVERD